ncbi:hypothetical protein RINTHH_890 [Richelia intracellularis HH01]|uniref:Uncharacterized protein n=1 Tax=Richelia intracellularis HH01 TaxID=1165094 RepID=M1WQ99_9NOST|nr:hypothetical protein RINTHH_890 [Richelia intracellularis HH01]
MVVVPQSFNTLLLGYISCNNQKNITKGEDLLLSPTSHNNSKFISS